MRPFPIEILKPLPGHLKGPSASATIDIPFATFAIEGEEVTTSIRLDSVDLPTITLEELVGNTFRYPINPNPGYIDGSIYIQHAHHPFDVAVIEFGDLTPNGLEITLTGHLALEHEGLSDFSTTLCTVRGHVR
jgi:hypothetical protein